MFSLAIDYVFLVTVATCGVIQLAAAWSGLGGLLIVRHTWASYALGTVLIVGAWAWFVAIGDPAKPGDLAKIEGAEQFGLFLVGAAVGTLLTAIASSLTQWRAPMRSDRSLEPSPEGLDALRDDVWLRRIATRFSRKPRRD